MKTLPLLLGVLLTTACGPYYIGRMPEEPAEELATSTPDVTAPVVAAAEAEPIADPVPASTTGAEEPALLGWNGEAVATDDRPLHELEADTGSRNYLIDLYVKSKERVDELELEVLSLHDLLASQEQVIAQRDELLGGERDEVTALEAELAAERARSADLEARLVTAQIRRLEAERQLLLTLLGDEELQPAETSLAAGIE